MNGTKLSSYGNRAKPGRTINIGDELRVQRGEEEHLLSENQSIYIPLGETHRLTNPGKIDLQLIEVQTGNYFGEDDIERLEDIYGRVNS